MRFFIAIICLMLLTGCQDVSKTMKHIQSNMVGLNRVVTLYAVDGSVIKEWKGNFMVELEGNSASFIVDGKEIKISGTFVVEEQ